MKGGEYWIPAFAGMTTRVKSEAAPYHSIFLASSGSMIGMPSRIG
jgi:hypothetical protein